MINNPVLSETVINDPNKFYVVARHDRWGASAFCAEIEFKHFHPSNKVLNDQLDMKFVPFGGAINFVVGVPKKYEETVKKIARIMGMKVCDGVPTLIENGKKTFFPLNGNNVWTLENRERPFSHITPYISENMECEAIHNGHSPISFILQS